MQLLKTALACCCCFCKLQLKCLVSNFVKRETLKQLNFYVFLASQISLHFRLQAHHMSICVRNEEDVTEDEIMKQVTKTTANFTFVQPTAVGSCGPVVSS